MNGNIHVKYKYLSDSSLLCDAFDWITEADTTTQQTDCESRQEVPQWVGPQLQF